MISVDYIETSCHLPKCSSIFDWIFQQGKQKQDGITQLMVVWLFPSQENLFEMRSLWSWKYWLAHT